MKLTYRDAGVSTQNGQKAVELMKDYVSKTRNDFVLGGIGGFSGLFKLDLEGIKNPVLVSGTDGVGTKLKLAFLLDKHETIGIDCVAMCVNDILCQGARPLFFLDYIATDQVNPQKISEIVKGISEACIMSDIALIGGETAEMPGFYQKDEYDMAGFCVGIVEEEKIIKKGDVKIGDALIGISSSGIHSNGFSLIRKLFLEELNMSFDDYVESLGETLGDALIRPTKIYTKSITNLLKEVDINGISHITGGGFYENIPRILDDNQKVLIHKNSWIKPEIFEYISSFNLIDEEELFSTFNMGIGMIIILPKELVEKALNIIEFSGEKAFLIGEVLENNGKQVDIV